MRYPHSNNFSTRTFPVFLKLSTLLICTTNIQAASFTVINGQTETAQQTLNDNEIGIIQSGGSLITTTTAIEASGVQNNIDNNGLISTTNNASYGINSSRNSVTINSAGTIITSGENSHAILSDRDNARISNSGFIITEGNNADGIFSTGDDAHITNSGSVRTSADNAYGITSSGDDIQMTNSGLITTNGLSAEGIISAGLRATIINSGSVITSDDDSTGIFSNAVDATIINSGSISTSGDDSHGIRADGDNTTIKNSGSIIATGSDSFAILGSSNDVTVDVLPGSSILGVIDLGSSTDNDTINIYSNSSSTLNVLNVENINFLGRGVVDDNRVYAVDTMGESSRGIPLWLITDSIHQLVNQRMNHSISFKPIEIAALDLFSELFEKHRSVAWTQIFGSRYESHAKGAALAYEFNHAGINLGYEWITEAIRVGIIGGIVNSATESSEFTSFESQSNHYYWGAYAHYKQNGLNITSSLVAGYSAIDNDRIVFDSLNGNEVARSTIDSYFFSPSLAVGTTITLTDKLQLRPSMNINYGIAWLNDYRETGTSYSNMNVHERYIKVLFGRIQLAAAYQMTNDSEIEFRTGINSRHSNDDSMTGRLGGRSFKFNTVIDEDVTRGFAGVSLRSEPNEHLSLVVDMAVGGNDAEQYVSGNLQLQYVF